MSTKPSKPDAQQDKKFPTDIFTIPEPQDQEIGEFFVVQERRATDYEAPKLWKGRLGCPFNNWSAK